MRPFLPLCCLPLPGGDRGGLGRKSEENYNRRRGERWFREEPAIMCVLGWGWGDLSCCFARRMARPIIQLEVKGESMVGWMFSPQLNSRPTHRSLNPLLLLLPPCSTPQVPLSYLTSSSASRRGRLWSTAYLRSTDKQQSERGTVSIFSPLFHYFHILYGKDRWEAFDPVELSPLHGNWRPG